MAQQSKELRKLHLRQLFADDPTRGETFTAEGAGLFFDYSKNRISETTLKLLLQLAEECDLRGRIDAMFRGEKINITEKRAVLHVALRAPKSETIMVDGKNVVPEVHAVLDKMAAFSNRVRSGEWLGSYRQAHQEHRKHRHRRLRPRASHGLRSSASITATAR